MPWSPAGGVRAGRIPAIEPCWRGTKITLVRGWLERSTYPKKNRASSPYTMDIPNVPGTSVVSEQQVDCLQQGRKNCLSSIETERQGLEKTGLPYAVG